MISTCRCLVASVLLGATTVLAYGPTGHEIVGAIADDLLAQRPAGKKVNELLDGISLQKAAVIPDEIKGWDKKGADDPKGFPHYSSHAAIDAQLREFWRANPPSQDGKTDVPSHHWFHYTDVPVARAEKYHEGRRGRSQWDIVHMIPYCVGVLRAQIPENNERKITKPVAIILLAHYLGDIHQPLHVGAEYFDDSGHATDPDTAKPGMEDQGGNTLSLELRDDPPRGRGMHKKKLHGFWDMDAVSTLLPPIPPTAPKEEKYQETESAIKTLAHEMAGSEPKTWRMPAKMDAKDYAEAWADEILPIAREAHERLIFNNVHATPEQDHMLATGDAAEKPTDDGKLYREWASTVVRDELQKAGWRLADLLEKTVISTQTIGASLTAAPRAHDEHVQGGPGSSLSNTESSGRPAPETLSNAHGIGGSPVPSRPGTGLTPAAAVKALNPPASAPPSALPSATLSQDSTPRYGSYPANYKEVVTSWLQSKGMSGSKIDWQGEPKPADIPPNGRGHLYGYLVIFNTPPQTGGTAKTRSVLIRDGQVVNANGF
jgi:hypothetical protein